MSWLSLSSFRASKKSPQTTRPAGRARASSRSWTRVSMRKGVTASRIVWRQSPAFADVMYILASFATLVALIGALGVLGFGAGLDISPIGEDYTWIDMLRRGDGTDAARLFWAIDHRNPLSPWWYIAARNIILNFDYKYHYCSFLLLDSLSGLYLFFIFLHICLCNI